VTVGKVLLLVIRMTLIDSHMKSKTRQGSEKKLK
jgi:hypothetical protein